MTLAIHRVVRKLEPKDDQPEIVDRRYFSDFLDIPNIILLGDPGAGKTYTFEEASKVEKGKILNVRQFLAGRVTELQGKTVYLDALDEYRSRIEDKNLVIELIKKLNELQSIKLRLSCRVADWLGESDLSLFRLYFGTNSYAVLILEPLTEKEVEQILVENEVKEVSAFIRNAKDRGLQDLLGNPQTLKMLSDVVKHGSWPVKKSELFENSCQILLSESNKEHSRGGVGEYSASELIFPAGAVAASILISGVKGINLAGGNTQFDILSFREIPFFEKNLTLACLTRRAFSGIGHETVTYIHRTIAEYLGAKWLAERIRNGLPLQRVQSLIGIAGHPASELRGLHAWLATLLDDDVPVLIEQDPYGILVYGDPGSLSRPNRQNLMSAIERLSQKDPWFRSDDWSDKPLGALSGTDMVETFRRLLSDQNSSFELKTVVLDAIKNGPPLPEMKVDMLSILKDSNLSYREHTDAVDALLRVIPDGEKALVEIYKTDLSHDPSTSRLRAAILSKIYNGNFGPKDVSQVFIDFEKNIGERTSGYIWSLSRFLPEGSLPDILDALSHSLYIADKKTDEPKDFEIQAGFSRMLSRAIKKGEEYEVGRLWRWLFTLNRLGGRGYVKRDEEDIVAWLSDNISKVLDMFDIAFGELNLEEQRYDFMTDFFGATAEVVPRDRLVGHILKKMESLTDISEKEVFLYETCMWLIFGAAECSKKYFNKCYLIGNKNDELKGIRDRLCRWEIPDWRIESNLRKLREGERREKDRAYNLKVLQENKEPVRTGKHLNILGFLAEFYFAMSYGVAKESNPLERIRKEFGAEMMAVALEGFLSVIKRSDLPSPRDIASLSVKQRYFPWWYSILAGMDEAWKLKPNLSIYPEKLLKSALALAYLFPTSEFIGNTQRYTKRVWRERILSEQPEIAKEVFETLE
jgi:hypothetical protein